MHQWPSIDAMGPAKQLITTTIFTAILSKCIHNL
jgi:hypothetical protein